MNRKILIIDDDPENRATATRLLESVEEAYVVLSCPDGQSGIEVALAELPDLIILDWQMPGLDGIQVLKQLKSHVAVAQIPVIMYTGIMTDSGSLRKALDLGAYDFLRKPVEPIEMEARIRAAIRLAEEYRLKMELEKKMMAMEKEQVQLELRNKTREATDYALFLAQKNETLIGILERLKDIISEQDLSPIPQRMLNDLISEINSSIGGMQYYEKFLEIFNTLHPTFNGNLTKISKELTPNDLKLLRFIKLNFGNKEMSALLNVSPAAIEKSKYRLKQKLNLRAEQALDSFAAAL
jgi:DNA-binding response OmpR family regulator